MGWLTLSDVAVQYGKFLSWQNSILESGKKEEEAKKGPTEKMSTQVLTAASGRGGS